jgi:hypothetical protein
LKCSIDDDLRELFEQYGAQVVAMALALGSNQGAGMRTRPVAPTHAMKVVHTHQDAAAHWDLAERRETICTLVNIALLFFFFWSSEFACSVEFIDRRWSSRFITVAAAESRAVSVMLISS